MATLPELRDALTDLPVPNREIEEPLAAPDLFARKLHRFPEELYNLHQDSHLYRFLLALCGEGGAGSIKKETLYSKLQSSLASTHFHDLDKLYGDPLALPRISTEIYTFDPKNDTLTVNEWIEIYAKDASYRNRCLLWMRAIIYGGTTMGMRLAAEAACGVECDIFAVADYLDDQRSDHPKGIVNLGMTSSDGEFVIVPRINSLTNQEKHRIIAMVDRVRPVDTLVTISLGTTVRTQKGATSVEATSDFSTILRLVTGRVDVDWPDVGGPASENLIITGSFENTVSPWLTTTGGFITAGATLTSYSPSLIAERPVFGSYVGKVVTPGGATHEGLRYANLLVQINQTYTFSIFVRSDSTMNLDICVGGTAVGTQTIAFQSTTEWQRVWITFTASSTGFAECAIRTTGTTAGTFYVDGAQFENMAAPTPYIPTSGTARKRPTTASNGRWIEAGIEKEAPTYAWMNRQESATFLDIDSVTASSLHYGDFNPTQKDIFVHLKTGSGDQFYAYSPDYSFTEAFSQIGLSIPWQRNDMVLVNNYYPLEYLQTIDLTPFNVSPANRFWASREDDAGIDEWLKFDLGRSRSVNYIEFEISQKPVTITVETSTDGINYTEVSPKTDTDYAFDISYLTSIQPWRFFRLYFDTVTARYVRITFTRRDDPFPFASTTAFKWSIEVRNFRAIFLMQSADDYVPDSGTDILGNEWRTDIQTFDPDLTLDGLSTTFWVSQPNPTPQAVEALYYDVSTTTHAVTMGELDAGLGGGGNTMGDYDTISMSSMESYITGAGAQTIDEIYVDPVFSGCDMHFYWSTDPQPEWESKLWHPVPRHYKCTHGYHALPYPVTARYFKVEFSNLTPIPYNTLDYPQLLPPLYRKFPTWVQNYFAALTPESLNQLLNDGEVVTIDPYDMFKIQQDALSTTRDQDLLQREEDPEENPNEISDIADEVVNLGDETVQLSQETQIKFFPPTFWRDDLKDILDLSRAGSRLIWQDEEDQFMVETTPEILDAPGEQSVEDLSEEAAVKRGPIMWFPRVCRHGYQVVTGPFQAKIAYQVAIREISFWYRGLASSENSEFGVSEYGGSYYG